MERTVNTATTDRRDWIANPSVDGGSPDLAIEHDATGKNIAAFEELVGRCEDKAYRLAMQLVGSESAALEILQQTFLSAWQNVHKFTGTLQFNHWVYQTVAKAAVGRLNSARHQGKASAGGRVLSFRTNARFWIRLRTEEEPDWATRPADDLCSEDLYCYIRKTIDALPYELRTVFILCDSEEMSVEDGAEILGLSVAKAKEDLQAARLAIRHAIGHYFSHGVHESVAAPAGAGIDHRHLSEASFTDP
jgi:RNA polymerase sigma-70 factor (ECF subfamily)